MSDLIWRRYSGPDEHHHQIISIVNDLQWSLGYLREVIDTKVGIIRQLVNVLARHDVTPTGLDWFKIDVVTNFTYSTKVTSKKYTSISCKFRIDPEDEFETRIEIGVPLTLTEEPKTLPFSLETQTVTSTYEHKITEKLPELPSI